MILLTASFIGKAKLDVECRVDVALQFSLGNEVGRVFREGLHILGVEFDGGEVGLDALGGGRLGEDGAATGDCEASA